MAHAFKFYVHIFKTESNMGHNYVVLLTQSKVNIAFMGSVLVLIAIFNI